MADTSTVILQVIGTGLFAGFAGVVGAFANSFFTRRRELKREAEARRREFSVFLYQWRSQLSRLDHNEIEDVWQHYLGKVNDHYAQIAKARTDFKPFKEFLNLAARLGDFRHKDVHDNSEKKNGRDVIAEAIDALIRFTAPSNDA